MPKTSKPDKKPLAVLISDVHMSPKTILIAGKCLSMALEKAETERLLAEWWRFHLLALRQLNLKIKDLTDRLLKKAKKQKAKHQCKSHLLEALNLWGLLKDLLLLLNQKLE